MKHNIWTGFLSQEYWIIFRGHLAYVRDEIINKTFCVRKNKQLVPPLMRITWYVLLHLTFPFEGNKLLINA